jgi:hypothetical protein
MGADGRDPQGHRSSPGGIRLGTSRSAARPPPGSLPRSDRPIRSVSSFVRSCAKPAPWLTVSLPVGGMLCATIS